MAGPRWMPNQRAILYGLGWALAAFFVLLWAILLKETRLLREEVIRSREEIAKVSRDLASERRWSVILSSSSMRTASFTRTPDADPAMRARAVVDPKSRRAVLVFENFLPLDGQVYEVWALHGTEPSALGRVPVDSSGRAVMRVPDVGNPEDLNAFTISLEPSRAAATAGAGAREPSGPIVMIGALGS